MLKVDLHTHSSASPDGGITAAQYRKLLDEEVLDFVAITDHDQVDFALEMAQELGARIIVGEEITTTDGEIVGLFLKKRVAPGQSPAQTVKAIHDQGGLVYIPHPFETVRKGIQLEPLNVIAKDVDIIEAHNGRALQNRSLQAAKWAVEHHVPVAASSDAHGRRGIGHTYTKVEKALTTENFGQMLGEGRLVKGRPPLVSLSYPKLNRFRKKLRRK